MDFSSFNASTGKNLAKSRKSVKKIPMVPRKIPMSTKVGWNMDQLEGK